MKRRIVKTETPQSIYVLITPLLFFSVSLFSHSNTVSDTLASPAFHSPFYVVSTFYSSLHLHLAAFTLHPHVLRQRPCGSPFLLLSFPFVCALKHTHMFSSSLPGEGELSFPGRLGGLLGGRDGPIEKVHMF